MTNLGKAVARLREWSLSEEAGIGDADAFNRDLCAVLDALRAEQAKVVKLVVYAEQVEAKLKAKAGRK